MSERLDPLVAGRSIESAYKRYLKTLLAPRDPAMAAAFDAAVDASTSLTKGPLLELTPPYKLGRSVRDLIDEGVLHPAFTRVGIDPDRALYVHQESAVRKAIRGRNLVVSTGTGSGKTESFLYPIIDSLLREHAAGTLGPGVRALLLYPMNALANDQLARLRDLLASVPEITFGRYTGETLERTRDAELLFRDTIGGEPLSNELLSREQMRESPPHVLLTNYAMLEYLLLRPADIELFEGDSWRFIALDEAHVYDGAQGSEVGLLLRRLKQRVAPSSSLQCIATSASLDGQPAEAMRFASALFDVPFEFVDDDADKQDLVSATRIRRLNPTWQMSDTQLFEWASGDSAVGADQLRCEERITRLEELLHTADGKRWPRNVRDLERALWPGDPESGRKLEALVALGSKVADATGSPVLSARYHMFVRATEGAFVSFADSGPQVFLARHERDPETGRAVFEFGTCQRCGAVHLAGEVRSEAGKQYFVPSIKGEGSVRWLVLTDIDGVSLIDEDEDALAEGKATNEPTVRQLCTGCGSLGGAEARTCSNPGCRGGLLRRAREHKSKTSVMGTCTECGARGRQVIRRLRTDVNAAPAVITTALYQQLPVADDDTRFEVGDGRKLLMFSDSRQAAAFAAPYLDRTYSRALERRYLVLALQDRKFCDDDLTVEDVAIIARRKAKDADHFGVDVGSIAMTKAANEWMIGELITLEQRQSLEGLGLMRVALERRRAKPLPRGFAQVGLSADETWDLLDELIKTARLQGALNLLDEVDITGERFEPRNTRIRIRKMQSDPAKKVLSWLPSGRPGTTNNRIKFVEKVLAALGSTIDANRILDACWDFLLDSGYLAQENDKFVVGVFQVAHSRLSVRNGRACDWYRCDTCRRVTAFNVRGVCANSACTGRLEPHAVPKANVDSHHYRTLYETLRTAPLSAKEHTAQWDSRTAAEIQRQFVDGKVNVLSCSTTFELGVDVGSLQSVMLRNMPPKTANYVQRAGRAGRRAESAALVLTYAKRSSHDLAKFASPESMIAGTMRIPTVPIENERIGRRHAHSVALAAFFREKWDPSWREAGAFFAPTSDGQDSPASRVRAFLTPVPDGVAAAVRRVLPSSVQREIGVDDGTWVAKLVDLLRVAEQDIRSDVDTFRALIAEASGAQNFNLAGRLQKTLRTIETRQLLGYLANKNILPKYGFPVDTVELRTLHSQEPIGAKLDLARDLSQAIYDYAPGNQVVAGGKVWTSRGLHTLPKRQLETRKYRVCKNCERFQCGHDLDITETCPSCSAAFGSIRTLVVPEFGFLADRVATDVGTTPPDRRWNGASYVEDPGEEVAVEPSKLARGVEVRARAGTRATMAVISDGIGAGFRLCDWCGWADPAGGKTASKKHQRPQTGQDCDGPLTTVSLAHRYQTDVAEFTFGAVDYSRDVESKWLSVLYALLEGAAESLEISRDDIDGTLSWSPDGKRSIVLFDTVPAGAGAAKRIAENIDTVLLASIGRVSDCECGEETSCYGCLRNFRNALVHERLSRRAALQIFDQLRIDTNRVPTYTASESAVDVLLRDIVPVPDRDGELGASNWPVDAVWPTHRVVLCEDSDPVRDTELRAEGYIVVLAAEPDVRDRLQKLLG